MDSFLSCRLLGHAWDPYTPLDKRPPAFGVALHWRCIRCTTVRRDIVSSVDGALLARRYDHPEGYKLGRDERPSTAELRVMAVRDRQQR